MKTRACGILLHPTSLPSKYGVGDMGPEAYRFAELLAEAGMLYWQMLPLGPTSPALGNSPYAGFTAFAGNPLLISPAALVSDGFLRQDDLGDPWPVHRNALDYAAVERDRGRMLTIAFERARSGLDSDPEFKAYCRKSAYWLDDWALFTSLKDSYGGKPWSQWAEGHRFRDPKALDEWREKAAREILAEKFTQYLFHKQWAELRDYCRSNEVHLFGDMPIYVAHDSADVWAHPNLFKLDADRNPLYVAGVPPDYFSATGQRWGNPVYNWRAHRESGFSWWLSRIGHVLDRFDMARVDHFRGFVGYWEIPAEEETAIKGRWVDSPGVELFTAMARRFPSLPIVAEDLGVITSEVRELRQLFSLPGMRIIQFAFGKEWPKHVPHLHTSDSVVYTGTHDNNTFRGWYRTEAGDNERCTLHEYLGHAPAEERVHLEGIRLAMSSVADTVIVPMQDVLGLDESCRMNRPSTLSGNWEWRLLPDEAATDSFAEMARMARFFDRAG